MSGNGLRIDLINKSMKYLIWTIIAVVGGALVYWLMDWEDNHPDGE